MKPTPIQDAPGEIGEIGYTKWFNPLDLPQKVDVHVNGRLMRYVVEPKTEVDIPAVYDSAIHIVHGCQDEKCRQLGGPCRKPGLHGGRVAGGLAPQLQRRAAPHPMTLTRALDTEAQRRDEAVAEARLASQAAGAAERALMVAAAKKCETERLAKLETERLEEATRLEPKISQDPRQDPRQKR